MEMTAAQRIRAEAREATRRALLEGGLAEMVAHQGLETPSIDDICQRAGYTKGAFYVYFRDRDHFVSELLDWVVSDIIRNLFVQLTDSVENVKQLVTIFAQLIGNREQRPDAEERGHLRAGYLAVISAIAPEGVVRDHHAQVMDELIGRFASILTAGQQTGEIRADLPPENLAALMVLIGVGTVLWDDVGIEFDPVRASESFMSLLRAT